MNGTKRTGGCLAEKSKRRGWHSRQQELRVQRHGHARWGPQVRTIEEAGCTSPE